MVPTYQILEASSRNRALSQRRVFSVFSGSPDAIISFSMSIGGIILGVRTRFRHGLRVAYYRDVVRPRILRTPPITGVTERNCEIHVLTSSQDWLNLIWALKSFYAASRRRYALCIHDDGTVSERASLELRRQFPHSRFISRSEADATVLPLLKGYPRSKGLRQTNQLSLKIFDFAHYLQCDRMLLLDSDVLFFSEPTELLRRIEDPEYHKNTVNGDIASAYTVTSEDVRRYSGLALVERFNSGLGLIHRNSLQLDWFEEFLSIPGIIGHFWQIEQTLFALCSSRFGVDLLPSEYDVRTTDRIDGVPCSHYVGAIRHLFYKEGIREIDKSGLLKWNESGA
jgi:hypothetical protein